MALQKLIRRQWIAYSEKAHLNRSAVCKIERPLRLQRPFSPFPNTAVNFAIPKIQKSSRSILTQISWKYCFPRLAARYLTALSGLLHFLGFQISYKDSMG